MIVITLAVKPHYYELAHNLALSCRLHGVSVHVMTDEVRHDPVFASELLIHPHSNGCEDIWRIKPRALEYFSGYGGSLAFVDADCLMLNTEDPVEEILTAYPFHQPTERAIAEDNPWAFTELARTVAKRYGIPDAQPLPQINGGFFCWRNGPAAQQWLDAFDHALDWCERELGNRREECAMMLANAALGLAQVNSDACRSLWICSERVLADDLTLTCRDHYGVHRRPTFGHYGSANTVPRIDAQGYQAEYRDVVARIKLKCLGRGIPSAAVHFAQSFTHPMLP